MPTFGFSAYLKLICLTERPRESLIRLRLTPSDSAYDFHRSLRRHAHRLIAKGESLDTLIASAANIVQKPERESVLSGLQSLEKWRLENSGMVFAIEPVTFLSPNAEFKVTFAPDFGIALGNGKVAIHVWNSKKPQLDARLVYAALSHFSGLYEEGPGRPDDLAVLCLRTESLYRLSQGGQFASVAPSLVSSIEDSFRRLKQEQRLPSRPDLGQYVPPPPSMT